MIVHINHISQSKKPRNGKPSPQSEMAGLVTGSLMSLVEDGVLDAKMAPSLRIHLDWIQYKTNFRDPVMVRRTSNAQGQPLPLAEIAIDLRQGCEAEESGPPAGGSLTGTASSPDAPVVSRGVESASTAAS